MFCTSKYACTHTYIPRTFGNVWRHFFVFTIGERLLLVYNEQRPEMLLNILKPDTLHIYTAKNYPVQKKIEWQYLRSPI